MIEAHWSRFLGVPASALRDPGMTVTGHAELGAYRGVWFFVRGRSAVVSAPPEWVARLEPLCRFAELEELLSPAWALRALGSAADNVIGPSFQGWLPEDRFRPVAPDGVRRSTHAVKDVVAALQPSCSAMEWEHGGIDAGAAEVWASHEGSRVAALGQLRRHRGGAVDPCVITHPAHRGRGHALRLVSAMSGEASSAGALVLYQTLFSNRPAIALALRLGFEEYARLLAVRLRADAS
jgi:GNAT superfamily N-acetyltransferase